MLPAQQVHLQFGADPAREVVVSWAAETRAYVYQVTSDGATPVSGAFRTAPEGRVPFRFTSVGDFGTGNPAWSKSAGARPWMPTLGNHENEPGNGPLGYLSYQTRFTLPDNHSQDYQGNWYKFQVGSVLFIALDNNDVVYQNSGGTYLGTTSAQFLYGYSGGVDLVLCGHDHGYERSYVVSGTGSADTLRPAVVSTDTLPTEAFKQAPDQTEAVTWSAVRDPLRRLRLPRERALTNCPP